MARAALAAAGSALTLGLLASRQAEAAAPPDPEAFVNTLGGTDSRYDMSHGNILPVVVRPWGFNAWAPVTDDDPSFGQWWFHPRDYRMFALRCTHQPSPWISDYGSFDLGAYVVDPSHDGDDTQYYSSYDPAQAAFSPFYFNATLFGYGTAAGYASWELTSTRHGAVIRARFPAYVSGPTAAAFNQTRRVALQLSGTGVTVNTNSGFPAITGASTSNNGGVAPNFAHYFSITVAGGEDGSLPVSGAVIASGSDGFSGAWVDFDPTNAATDTLIIRVATSLISQQQAGTNFAAQVANRTFDAVAAEAQAEWRALLSTTALEDVGAAFYDADEQAAMLTTWYSNIYRASQFPRKLFECVDGGQTCTSSADGAQHWSPYTGATLPGVLSADEGFWDAYRTLYGWHALVNPGGFKSLVQGWNNAFLEGGWLPKWASPGYRGSMVGTMGDVSLADAIVKGVITGDDAQTAYAAIRKDAFTAPPDGQAGEGRTCLAAYLADGYIASGSQGAAGTCSEVVSRTLNYYLSDWSIARAAEKLGYTADAAVLDARAANYSKLFEPTTGFMRSRATGMGPFTEPFDEFRWGGPDYTEAGPWQYRFEVTYDPHGLYQLYAAAGLDMCALLEQSQTMVSTFHVGGYGSVIHEQTEMAVNVWGQNEHGNQPEHAMMWMLAAADNSTQGSCASRAQFWLRQMTSLLYRPGADAYPGDEDNGQMATWYLLSALGLYELAPGGPDYQLGSPLFTAVSIALPGGGSLNVTALNNCATCVYVAGVTWNGVPVSGTSIAYSTLMQGGTLTFNMTENPPSGVPGGPNPKAAELQARAKRSRDSLAGRVVADFLRA